MPPKNKHEPIEPNPFAHLMPSERFTPPDRQDCREMTVTDPKTGEEVLMLKRGFGETAVWKPAEEWKAESKAMWREFYKTHPAPPPPREYGSYPGDFDGNGNYPPGTPSSYEHMETSQPKKRSRFEGWDAQPIDEKKSAVQVFFETIMVLIFLAMPIMALIIELSGR